MKARIKALIEWAKATRAARTFFRFGRENGPLLGQGLSYQSIFAVFAALWVAFAVLGIWIQADSPLQRAIIDTIDAAVPGLIDRGDGEGGAIAIAGLLSVPVLGWTGAIAAIILAWTAIGWFGAARGAVRAMLEQPSVPQNALILKLKDAALALAFGIAVIVSSALSLASTGLLGAVLGWFGLEASHPFAVVASRIVGLVIALAFDTAVLWSLYRVLAVTAPPRRAIWQGALGGAVALGVLKALGGLLLGGATSNPLLASFAVIIGLLIWLNLVCMVLLLAAAWIGETAADLEPDAGSAPDDERAALDGVEDAGELVDR